MQEFTLRDAGFPDVQPPCTGERSRREYPKHMPFFFIPFAKSGFFNAPFTLSIRRNLVTFIETETGLYDAHIYLIML
jgi:hypothetical protein